MEVTRGKKVQRVKGAKSTVMENDLTLGGGYTMRCTDYES